LGPSRRFVGGESFDRRVGMARRFLGDDFGELF
jgi:hypothetical protein